MIKFFKVKEIIDYKLDDDIFSNDTQYFFTLLGDRFDWINKKLVGLLEKRFNRKFKPIHVLQAEFGKYYPKNNYIIINKKLKELRKSNPKIIFIQHDEDSNREFAESVFIKSIIKKLQKKQNKIFIMPFTSSGLHFNDPKIILIGPKPDLVERLDNKINQLKIFKELNLPRNKVKIYKKFHEIQKDEINLPCFISAANSSGGHENRIVFNGVDLERFFSKLGSANKNKEVFIAEYVDNIKHSPNVTALVTNQKEVKILLLTDQILKSTRHFGNIYPSEVNAEVKQNIFEITQKLGKYLASNSFRGLFGCDFIVDKNDKCYIVDLNPRRQGSYLMFHLMAKGDNILDAELKIALNENFSQLFSLDIPSELVLAYSKISPNKGCREITEDFHENEELTPFLSFEERFISSFHPKNFTFLGDCYGQYLVSGNDYSSTLDRLNREVAKIVAETTCGG